MLLMGLLGRFTNLINLPSGWSWMENGWVLTIVAVLLAVEIVADKVPALDSVNDTVQTLVRPTAGGIVFGSGFCEELHQMHDWVPARPVTTRSGGSRWWCSSTPTSPHPNSRPSRRTCSPRTSSLCCPAKTAAGP